MFGYILVFWNIAVFLMYGYDKFMAIKNGWRVSEKTLLICAFLLGGLGAYLAMIGFRHKTKHINFKIFLPMCAVITIFVFIFINRL